MIEAIDKVITEQQAIKTQTSVMSQQIDTSNKLVAKVERKVSTLNSEALQLVEQQEFAQKMVENLINDLLDLAKMQKSSFQLNQEYFNLPKLVYDALLVLNS
jgi:prophage DNA circulation protein